MKSEREKFKEYMRSIGAAYSMFELDEDGNFDDMSMRYSWEAWQAAKAQAVPEGFVVALKEPDLKMIEAAAQEHAENGASYRTMYKAMISAGEKK